MKLIAPRQGPECTPRSDAGETSHPRQGNLRLTSTILCSGHAEPDRARRHYFLPEAQVDRFMFKLKVGYPTMDEEHIVMQRMASPQPTLTVNPVLTIETLMELREQLGKVFIDPKVERHILRIVDATRNPAKYDLDIGRYLRFGASPRASIYFHWEHAGKH